MEYVPLHYATDWLEGYNIERLVDPTDFLPMRVMNRQAYRMPAYRPRAHQTTLL